jgi:hypothetical protein
MAGVTPSDKSLAAAIQYSPSLGMEVLLNAHIEVSCIYFHNCTDGKSRTSIDFGKNTGLSNTWFQSCTDFITHYYARPEGVMYSDGHRPGAGVLEPSI